MQIIEIPGRQKIKDKIKERGGYCPCSLIKSEDTVCPCKEFRESTELERPCHCGLYVKVSDCKDTDVSKFAERYND